MPAGAVNTLISAYWAIIMLTGGGYQGRVEPDFYQAKRRFGKALNS